ncbi:MAG: Uma2 family endonuclease [Desulfobacteraceae bacterium]|nr:Uma2 family endonuclease [Desulfobacteraceae bacterium]
MWQEEVVPFIAVELLSPGTRKEDLGKTRRKSGKPPTKWQVYEKILGIPYYIVFSHYTDELLAFELIRGRYRKIPLPEKRVWLPEIKLGLGLWRGTYKYLERKWMRWYDVEGNWIPTSVEKEKQRAETAEQRAESAEQHTERLLAQLKALGIKPDSERE